MPVLAGIVTGCGEGLERNRAAIRITRRMMPPIMSQGRHRSPGHLHSCFIRLIIIVITLKIRIVFPD
jgi:hypothetical protein